MSNTMYTTTKKDFEVFKKACDTWLVTLGLVDWDVLYSHVFINGNVLADCEADSESRKAMIRLNKNWDTARPTGEHLKSSGKHEALHVFTANIMDLATSRYILRREVDEGIHSIIEVLVKLL